MHHLIPTGDHAKKKKKRKRGGKRTKRDQSKEAVQFRISYPRGENLKSLSRRIHHQIDWRTYGRLVPRDRDKPWEAVRLLAVASLCRLLDNAAGRKHEGTEARGTHTLHRKLMTIQGEWLAKSVIDKRQTVLVLP